MSDPSRPQLSRTWCLPRLLLGAVTCAATAGCGDDVMRLGQLNQTATVGAVDKLVLRDAQSAARIQDLPELTTLSIAELKSPKVSIEAVVSGAVSSVAFLFDRNELVEVEEPFTYPGDIDGDLKSFDAEVGSHSITATPYSALGAEGQRGASFKVVLTFVE